MTQPFTALVLGGGGTRGFCYTGILHDYYIEKKLNLQEVVGTSIGSLIGTLLVCGYTPFEIFTEVVFDPVESSPLTQRPSPKDSRSGVFDFQDLGTKVFGDIFNRRGLIDISVPLSIVSELIKKKMGKVPTMKELYLTTGKLLKITVVNMTQMKVRYLDHRNSPNLLVTKAIEMSCNVPLMFQKIIVDGQEYADGGFIDNFPFFALEPETLKHGRILGIVTKENTSDVNDTFLNFIYRLLVIPIDANTKFKVSLAEKYPNATIIRTSFKTNSLDFSIDRNASVDMFNRGIADAQGCSTKKSLDAIEWAFEDPWGEDLEDI